MTREKWEKMTGDERRIKVAELCGLAPFMCGDGSSSKVDKLVMINGDKLVDVPDYLNDLNAMHEVEKVFLQEDGCAWGDAWEKYCDNLAKICFLAEPVNCLMRATASQRAEAFVLTMEKE